MEEVAIINHRVIKVAQHTSASFFLVKHRNRQPAAAKFSLETHQDAQLTFMRLTQLLLKG